MYRQLRSLRYHIRNRVTSLRGNQEAPPPMETCSFQSLTDYMSHLNQSAEEYERRRTTEFDLLEGDKTIHTKGYCIACRKEVRFKTDFLYSDPQDAYHGQRIPNWRERLICSGCRMNSRVRGAIQFFEEVLGASPDDEIYVTEQLTPLFHYLKCRYRNLSASEYLGNTVPPGNIDTETGVRNESLTRLSFSDDSFRFILSFDVLEHIPDYLSAFSECLRCLKPGGILLFSVPFARGSENNLVRATVDSAGEVNHILPPEYHGDPVSEAGCLCFYHFGWELLGQVRNAGFSTADVHFYWSDRLGYLGEGQMLMTARKPG